MKLVMIACIAVSGVLPVNAAEPYFKEVFARVHPARWSVDTTPSLSGFLIRPFDNSGADFGMELRMENRVSFITKADFPDGAKVSLRTTYEDTGDPKYVNQVILMMRTTGNVRPMPSWEMADGLRLRIEYGHGKVTLEYANPKTGKVMQLDESFVKANNVDEGLILVDKAPTEYSVPQVAPGKNGGNWYTVEYTDNPEKGLVEAYLTWHRRIGEGSAENRKQVASITYATAKEMGCDITALPGAHVALSSRELAGGKLQVSFVRNFEIAPVTE